MTSLTALLKTRYDHPAYRVRGTYSQVSAFLEMGRFDAQHGRHRGIPERARVAGCRCESTGRTELEDIFFRPMPLLSLIGGKGKTPQETGYMPYEVERIQRGRNGAR